MSNKNNPKILTQLQDCENQGIPLAVIIASGEIESGTVIIRNIVSRKEETYRREDLIDKVKELLSK